MGKRGKSSFLAVLVALAVAFGAFSAWPVAAEENQTVRLEIEDITGEQIVEDANVSGGKFQRFNGRSDQTAEDVVQTFVYHAEEAGYYQISVSCAPYVQGNYLSRMYVNVNEGEYAGLNTLACVVSEQPTELASGDATFRLSLYTCKTPVYLEAGENRIDVKAVDRINAAGAVVFGLDYVELKKTNPPHTFPVGRIEIEDIADEQIKEDANTSGEKFQRFNGRPDGTTEDVVQTFLYDVEEAGYYQISVSCAPYVQGSSDFLSRMYVRVNKGEYTELSAGNCTVSAQPTELASGDTTFRLSLYTCKTPVYLEAGENRIDIKAIERVNGTAAVVFGLDYVELQKTEEPSAFPVGRVEAESISDSYIVSDQAASGGKIQIYKGAGVSDDVVQRFIYNVEETGYYRIGIACGSFAVNQNLSQMSFRVNEGEYVVLDQNSSTVSSSVSLSDATFNPSLFTYDTTVALHKGQNTIDVRAVERFAQNQKNSVYFSLDYVELAKAEPVSALPVNGRIELEQFAQEWNMETETVNTASDSVVVKKADAGARSDEVTFRFTAKETGTYIMALGAGCEAWAEWLSPLSVQFDSEPAENIGDEAMYRKTDVTTEGSGFRSARMTRLQPVTLEKGEHTVTVRAEERKSNNGGVYYSLDYLDLIRIQNSELPTLPGNGRIEAETFARDFGWNSETLDVCSAGAEAVLKDPSSKNAQKVFSIAFRTEISDEEGKAAFVPSIGAANERMGIHLSPIFMSVNGGPAENISSFIQGETQAGDATFRCTDFTPRTNQWLYDGINVVTFYVMQREQDGLLYGAVDYVDFIKARDNLHTPALSVPGQLVTGDSGKATVTDGDGVTVTPADVYQMTFSSSDETVAVVDGEGTITAKAAGNTEIKAVIRVNKNSEEVVLTQNLLVVREGVSLSSLTNESGKIRFTVHTGTALNSAQAVVMCSQDGRPVEIKLIPIPAIDVNGSYQAETTLTGYEQGQQIRVFLWDSLSGMKPLCQSMTL